MVEEHLLQHPECDNVINVVGVPDNTTKTTFCWDTVSTYSFVRLQYRENVPGSSFSNIGGFEYSHH